VSSEPGSSSPQIVVVQTTIPDYRTRFFEALSARLGRNLTILSGTEDWYSDVKHAGRVPHVATRNHFLARRQLLWQSRALTPLLRADVAVVGLNPRIVTNWIALVLRRLLRRRTVLWGHAWPRRGMTSNTDRLRAFMRRLADTVIVYTETEADTLRRTSPGIDVVAAPNALYAVGELTPLLSSRPTDFVCVGRLNPTKKPDLLLRAFVLAVPRLPADIRLVFVGDGALRYELEQQVRSAALDDRVRFLGHVSALDQLRGIYEYAIASISPGYVGLSLLQSLGFGTPMLIARDEPHAPEIEAAVEGLNAIFFDSDSAPALANVLVEVAKQRHDWESRRSSIAEDVQNRYSIERMVESFIEALHTVSARSRTEPGMGEREGRQAKGAW
jgi:glycosyltransferase involved in cell wall biosynthesis